MQSPKERGFNEARATIHLQISTFYAWTVTEAQNQEEEAVRPERTVS